MASMSLPVIVALILGLWMPISHAGILPCAKPSAPWQVEPQGTNTTLAGLNTYVAGPADLKGGSAVIFISDVFGWGAKANRNAADLIASKSGVPVYIPDFFEGDTLTNSSQIGAFLARHGPAVTVPLLDNVIAALNTLYGPKAKLGAIGFCWGGKYSLISGTNFRTDATVTCHPSLVNATQDGLTNTTAPALFLLAENDFLFDNATQAQVFSAIQSTGTPYLVKEYSGVKHGFCVRCDAGDTVCEAERYEALSIAATWFAVLLKGGVPGPVLKVILYIKKLIGM